MSLIGQVVDGKYEVLRLVGEGAMGAVYEAKHLIIGRHVALKILHAQLAAYPQMMERFLQEARVAGSLGHGNICEVTDLGMTEEGQPFLVLPFLEGRSLRDELVRHLGRLPTERVFDILCQVMVALQRAHEMNVVHRDLKPENIFLTQMGERTDFVKVLDFGISKVIAHDALDAPGLTVTGTVLGTPYYMSPEQARGVRDVDYRVDVYAVAVLAFEMLTGRRPFEGENYNEVIYSIATLPFPDAHLVEPTVPQAVADVIRRGGAKASADRWGGLRDFRRALVTAARDAGLQLPRYLSQPDTTGEIELQSSPVLAPRGVAPGGEPERAGAPTVVGRPSAAEAGPAAASATPVGAQDRTVLGHPVREPASLPAQRVPASADSWVNRPIQLAELEPPPVPGPGPSWVERIEARANPAPVPAEAWVKQPLRLKEPEPPPPPGPGPTWAERVTARANPAPGSTEEWMIKVAEPDPPAVALPSWEERIIGPVGGPGRPVTPRPHPLRRLLVLGALALLLVAAGLSWWLLRADRPSQRRSPGSASEAAAPESRRSPDAGTAAFVRIFFSAEPLHSVLTFRGKTTREKVLTLPRSQQGVKVQFHARGYVPQEITVVPDRDRTVLVSLSRR